MSKHPSPRLDQLRAMREAKFARSLQSQRAEEKPAPARRAPAIVQEAAPAAAPVPVELAPAAPAKKTAAKKPKAAAKPPAKKKAKKKAG
jgi:H+-translocating NAD(P) transhydrogenase subunit alpha